MLSPADERRHLVLVLQPLSCPKNKSGPVVVYRAGGGVSLSNPPTTTQPGQPTATAGVSSRTTPTDTEKDPHNEVERRRKLRISRSIKTLAETLTPPCHCGKTTRADILTRVVERIKELKQQNSELQAQIKELQKPTDGVELSRQAIKLIEENLRLRTLLLGHKDSQSQSSGDESQKPESSKEQEDVGTTAGKEIEEEIMESEREVPPALISSSSSSQAGSSSASGRDEKENEDVQQEGGEAVDNASKEVVARGSAEEQPWPISSLLSDDSRNGSKDHNLPILSPTYIAEHCSTTSCEAHFFPPPVSSLPRASNLSNVGTSRSTSLCSHVGPTTETLTADGGPSTTVPPRSILYSSSVSHVTPHPPTPPYPSPTTRQSIVQPWIGGPISRNENTVIQSSVIMQPSPLQSTVPETGRWPVHRAQLRGCQHSVASMVRYTNHRQHMYNPRPSHSARSRVGLRTQYTSTGEQYITDESAPTRVYTHREGRGHCSEVHSSYPTTGSSFQLCAGSVNPSMSPSFPNPSTDICFHHSVQPMHSPALPPPLTQHNSHSLNIGHHPHPHQHNYPLPPHPHPSFTSHPHHPPSHHSTVWRPYSDRQRTATRFSLSDILSPSLTSTPTLGLPTPVSPLVHQSPGGRTPSFFVDHLLDDL